MSSSQVYVIGNPATEGPVKIGTTTNLAVRLTAIQAGKVATPKSVDSRAVRVLFSYPGDRMLERRLHVYYARWRLVGEWFDIPAGNAANLLYEHLDESHTVEAVIQHGVECTCHHCRFVRSPDERPGDREELDDTNRVFMVALHALTHARLGVNMYDDHVGLPASHCDIDRAVRLVEAIEWAQRQAAS